jgi:hypothetical protein
MTTRKERRERKDARDRLIRYTHHTMSICEKLRTIYDDVADYPDKKLKANITEKLVDCMLMTKNIASRFAYYRDTYHDKTGSHGKHLGKYESEEFHRIKKIRKARKP